MTTVNLKNGTTELQAVVTTTMMNLELLAETDGLAIYELAMKCRDSNHRIWGNYASVLQGLSLLQSDGSVHASVKNIVLSAVSGEGLEMTLGSPIATSAQSASQQSADDLTTPAGVRALMETSKSESEWNQNCKKVKAANNNDYPSFWFATIIISGLGANIMSRFNK